MDQINLLVKNGCAVGHGKRGRDSMRAGLWSPQARNARRLSAKINDRPDSHWHPSDGDLRSIKTHLAPTRRIDCCGVRSRSFRVRTDPTNIRLRCELPHTKIPPIPEHCITECVHIGGHACGAPAAELAGGVQTGDGVDRRVVGAELVVVDHCGGAGGVYLDERYV